MKIIFLGTPDFAVGVLQELYESRHDVVAVVSQPDRAKDRKGNLLPTPVKAKAAQYGIKCYQFDRIKAEGVLELKQLNADIMVTAAYGQMLSKEVLEITPFGVVNVHASLLPKYRGSAPIQWAVINGEKSTGITIMQTDIGMDSGDILATVKTDIEEDETSGELFDRLKVLGAKLLVDTLDKLERGDIVPVKQNADEATKCRMLTKEDGHIDFTKSKRQIVNLVNGVTPVPGAFFMLSGAYYKVGKVRAVEGEWGKPGLVSVNDGVMTVACADGGIVIEQLQPSGKKMMKARDFLLGHAFDCGTVLS